ncbi:MAG: indolepyruvate ferredoxin oxidoreductase family protein, partial [Pseudomonadota bacterium]|nr:indolepyruvate ferredoxin oxidoreductase family protein [Pseudomonadota bacterium]
EWGRRAAHDLASMEKLFASAQVIAMPAPRQGLQDLVARRVAFLTAYQNAAYAKRYENLVGRVQQTESALGKTQLSEAVARYLFKLMACKDEYEVARLHTDRSFHDKVGAMFEGDYKLNYHLAPPIIAKTNDRGELQKQKFGPWMLTGFKVLAKLKGLRGTALDPFGRTEERRMERALIVQYESCIEEILHSLTAGNHAAAVDVARIPELIKGYGHVKARHVEQAQLQWTVALAAFRQPQAVRPQLAA